MSTRREQLIREIEDVLYPRCKEPGCVFRTPRPKPCPLHGVDMESPQHDYLEPLISGNGRPGGAH